MRNVVIIGSGCAGLTAAIYAARANLKPLVIRGVQAGGQLTLTTLVENFPGFPKGVQGPELIELMQKQATEFGAEFLEGNVTKVDLSQRPFVLEVGRSVWKQARSSSPRGLRQNSWVLNPSASCWGTEFPPAPLVTVTFSGERKWWWWAAATRPRKMRSS